MKDLIVEIETNKEILKQVCEPIVKLVDNPVLDEICLTLIDTYKANINKCVGLAANQVGFQKKVILIRTKTGFEIMINPTITPCRFYGKTRKKESCLSHPGLITKVNRYKHIKVSYYPYAKLIPSRLTKVFTGIKARIIQHEIDHLQGILI